MGDMFLMGGMDYGVMGYMNYGVMGGMFFMSGMDLMFSMDGMDGMDSMEFMDGKVIMQFMLVMDYSQYQMGVVNLLKVLSKKVCYVSIEYGFSIDVCVDSVCINLDDLGVGLCNNGCCVLMLVDMYMIGGLFDQCGLECEVEFYLIGNMECYVWLLDGLEFGKFMFVYFCYGECLCVILYNDMMMIYFMYLYGLWSELEMLNGDFLV